MNETLENNFSEYDRNDHEYYKEFKLRCLEDTGDAFQKLFEDIMVRAKPGEFERIRPYGKFGDRKCDGLIESEGIIFQVYSPDELKQSEVRKKIKDDLAGAIENWGDILKKWIFVYNARRGTTADIQVTLREKQKQYPQIQIESWSNDFLWEITRDLNQQQKAEIFGTLPLRNQEDKILHLVDESSLSQSNHFFESIENSFKYPTLPVFLGREDLIEQINSYLEHNGMVVVGGIPGIGKTALAAKIAQQADEHNPVLWIDCESHNQFEKVIVKVAIFLINRFNDYSLSLALKSPSVDNGFCTEIAISSLCKHKCLMVWDQFDAKHNETLKPLLKISSQVGPESKILITTQEWFPIPELLNTPHLITLSNLNFDEGFELVKFHARRLGIGEPPNEVFQEIFSRVDGHPYILCLLIGLGEVFSFSELLGELPFFTDEAHSYVQNKVFEVLPSEAQKLILRLSILRFPFRVNAIKYFVDFSIEYKVFKVLARRFLITRLSQEEEYYEIHSLIRDYCRLRDADLSLSELHERAVSYYESLTEKRYLDALEIIYHASEAQLFEKAKETAENMLAASVASGKYDFLLSTTSHFLNEPNIPSWGFIYHFRGRALRFKDQIEEAIKEYDLCLSSDISDFYKDAAKSEISGLLLKLGQSGSNAGYYDRAAKYCNELLNNQYPYMRLQASAILGCIEAETDSVENGLELLSDTLEKAIQGDFQNVVSGIHFKMAHVYEKINDLEKAAECLEQSRNVQKNINQKLEIRDIEADYFISMGLGRIYSRLKRYEESILFWEKCIGIDREMSFFGRLAHSLYKLGYNQCLIEDFNSAYKTLYECLSLIREHEIKAEGAERGTLAWLALASWNTEKYEEALEYYFEHNIVSRREKKSPYLFLQIKENDLQSDADLVELYKNGAIVFLVPKAYSLQEFMQSIAVNLVKRRSDLRQELHSLELLRFERPVSRGFGKPKIPPNQKCPCGSGKKYKKCCGKR